MKELDMPRKSAARKRSRANSEMPQRRTTRSRSRTAGRAGGRRAKITSDHEEIRRWAEERGGIPACVKGTGARGDTGMIRLEFPGLSQSRDESLQEITWDQFFDEFDKKNLALTYEETTAKGERSNFNKLVSRENAGRGTSRRRKSA